MKALLLNCTLKKSPATSNTQALIDLAVALFKDQRVDCETLRISDYRIEPGVTSDEGDGDQWPLVLEKIKQCHILLIGSPIWFGVRSSLVQRVFERLDGTYQEADSETGQYPLYNKVGGVLVTGNEDGAHNVSAHTLFNLSHLGCTIPPNSDTYWVGEAGPGPSFLEANGATHLYTNQTVRYMVHNVVYFARLLNNNPIPTNLNQLNLAAEEASSI